VWGNSRREVLESVPPGSGVSAVDVQSLTFIPGTLDDNPRMVDRDPRYRGKLLAMTRVNRARLLEGNWKVRASSGSYFKRSDVNVLDIAPANLDAVTRRWDLAASEPTDANKNPDWTCGVKMGRYPDGRFVVLHAEFARKRAGEVRALIDRVAEADGDQCSVGVPQDPAQAGKDQADSYVRDLAGHGVYAERETGDKETRAEPCAAQWQHQNIDVVRGPWNEQFFSQLEAFPDPKVHDDAVDALSGAFRKLIEKKRDIFAQFRKKS
jgi:predicted phage terminase large subunit-like protein